MNAQKNPNDFTIRPVTEQDAPQLLEIYAFYVQNTAITFEYDVPTIAEFEQRIRQTVKKYPYLCAEQNGTILGYAYAGAFHPRAAYQWSAEVTVYVDHSAHKKGFGKALYAALESYLQKMGITNLYACIAVPKANDEYLTKNSAEFHAHLGFTTAGEFTDCGYKFNRWYNMVWMQKIIAPHTTPQAPVVPFLEV